MFIDKANENYRIMHINFFMHNFLPIAVLLLSFVIYICPLVNTTLFLWYPAEGKFTKMIFNSWLPPLFLLHLLLLICHTTRYLFHLI